MAGSWRSIRRTREARQDARPHDRSGPWQTGRSRTPAHRREEGKSTTDRVERGGHQRVSQCTRNHGSAIEGGNGVVARVEVGRTRTGAAVGTRRSQTEEGVGAGIARHRSPTGERLQEDGDPRRRNGHIIWRIVRISTSSGRTYTRWQRRESIQTRTMYSAAIQRRTQK